MTGTLVGLLLAAAWAVCLVGGRNQAWLLPAHGRQVRDTDGSPREAQAGTAARNAAPRKRSAPPGWSGRKNREEDLHRFPLLVHQLAGLLDAGRTPGELWADVARLSRDGTGPNAGGLSRQTSEATILTAAARAAGLGLSPVPVLREAGRHGAGIEAMVWNDLAACVHASERSGAPLAGILKRYADGLEAVLDARAVRATALSGPKATVRVLTWLPAAGLVMGYALGADPLATLTQTSLGWSSAAAGMGLALAGWVWTRILIRQATGPGPG